MSRYRVLIALGLLSVASPAFAQWSQVAQVQATDIFSVSSNGDTIVAAADTATFVSTNGGVSWQKSSKPIAGVTSIQSAFMRHGRLYAGTFGQGVFVSDNLGATWQPFNQGLVGGPFDTQLDIGDLVVRGDSLYAGTLGAGVYVRSLAPGGTWSHFGEIFEPEQASNITALSLGGTRLLAAAGANGAVFFRDPGDPEWTISWLDNVGIHAGLQADASAWNGSGWVVGVAAGVLRSVLGQEPWSFTGLGLGGITHTAFAPRGRRLFAAFNTFTRSVIEHSTDDGATWLQLESLNGVFVYRMAFHGTDLYAGRADGLWVRATATISVPRGDPAAALRFALLGAQPAGDDVRFSFDLPEAASATIEVFDAAGRRAATTAAQFWPAGTHEASVDASRLPAGVYQARLSAGGRQGFARIVHIR